MPTATIIKHVLVIDDNPGDLGLFHLAMEGIAGVELHTVTSVVQGNAFLRKLSPFAAVPTPDLVFLDLRLPIFPGHILLPTVKNDPLLRHVKVLVFTSSTNDHDMNLCRELGADDYIVKPRDWPQWKSTISALLASHCGIIADASAWDGKGAEPLA